MSKLQVDEITDRAGTGVPIFPKATNGSFMYQDANGVSRELSLADNQSFVRYGSLFVPFYKIKNVTISTNPATVTFGDAEIIEMYITSALDGQTVLINLSHGFDYVRSALIYAYMDQPTLSTYVYFAATGDVRAFSGGGSAGSPKFGLSSQGAEISAVAHTRIHSIFAETPDVTLIME